MTPAVSVVVPAFQNRATIAATMHSILSQTYTDFELVVADHSSTDGTLQEARRSTDDPRVRFVSTAAGGGAARNWDRVTEQARGSLLKLVCGDDLLYPTCLAEQVAALRENPSAALAAVRRDLVDAAGRVLVRDRGLGRMSGLVVGQDAVRATVRAGTNLLGEPMCTLLRTDLVRQVGGWATDKPFLMDEDLYVRLLAGHDLVALPRTLAAFRVSAAQWSVRLASDQARQAVAFHRELRSASPGLLSAWDETVGRAAVGRTALLRRAAYVVWRRRMAAQPV